MSHAPVDLRSDTVTRPSLEMYEAMRQAALGDDVLGDDPTVIELEALAAKTVGMEQGLFVPSGTMGNQIAIATHTKPGDAMLVEEEAHVLYYEVGGPAIFNGVVSWTLPSDHGVLDPDVIRKRILKANLHTPGTTLLCLENTHNRAGGTITPPDIMEATRAAVAAHGLKVHLDGARVFNASVALGVPVTEITRHVDTVNFCLSKGLRAPVGSVLCGPAEFIERARIWRKRLGGGMRQAGILAACGIVSLTKMIDRLSEDHRRAQAVAQALADLPGLCVDVARVQTNIVVVQTEEAAAPWVDMLRERGVWCFAHAPNRLRLVLHADVDDAGVKRASEAFREIASCRG